jgi:transposase
MNARQEKGLVIAATLNIQPKGEKAWVVPSQTLNDRYTVTRTYEGFECTCPDYDLRHSMCKHGFAVEFYLRRETTVAPDGETTVTETRAVRMTYAQNWPQYNRAQTVEKEMFCHLLRDLCAVLPQPERGMGRPSIPVADAIFAAAFKVYSSVSCRRFMTDLREASAQGHISRAWHYNTVLEVIEDEAITPLLHGLIAASSAPLASVESAFAVDSTGFGTQSFYRHFTAKHGGGEQTSRNYLKLHANVGTKTNVIASAVVTNRDSHDYNEFAPLLNEAAKSFTIKEVSADKAYIGQSNLDAAAAVGAEVYIPFKHNMVDHPTSPLWTKLFHLYNYRQDEFLPHYHLRSNSESAFSAIKRLFGETLRSKLVPAQVNELLLKVIAYNVTRMIHSIFELGVTVPGISGTTQAALTACGR